MKRFIPLPIAFIILFLILSTPTILSADSTNSKNIWEDNSCNTELKFSENPWKKKVYENRTIPYDPSDQHVSAVFVGEVVWAEPRKEVGLVHCGIAVGSRNVRYRVTEVLLGDLKVGSEIELRHDWCEFYDERYSIGAKIVVGLIPHFYSNLSDLGFWGWRNSKVAWELPLNPANREITKNFIQCIHDKGIVKAMEKENEEDENEE